MFDLFWDFKSCPSFLLNDDLRFVFIHPAKIKLSLSDFMLDKKSLGSFLGSPAFCASPKPDFLLVVIIGSKTVSLLAFSNEPAVVITIVLKFDNEPSFLFKPSPLIFSQG